MRMNTWSLLFPGSARKAMTLLGNERQISNGFLYLSIDGSFFVSGIVQSVQFVSVNLELGDRPHGVLVGGRDRPNPVFLRWAFNHEAVFCRCLGPVDGFVGRSE